MQAQQICKGCERKVAQDVKELRQDFDDRARAHLRIDRIDLFIGNGDTSIGPVLERVIASDPAPLRS
jgi:hypothetical protein